MKKTWVSAELVTTEICETACETYCFWPPYPTCPPSNGSGDNTVEKNNNKPGCGGFWFWPWF